MFDMAGVRLLHGWLIDPQDKVLTELVGDMTYNQIVEVAMSKLVLIYLPTLFTFKSVHSGLITVLAVLESF